MFMYMLVNGSRSFLGLTSDWIPRFIDHNRNAQWFPLLMFRGDKRLLREWQKVSTVEKRFRTGLRIARREGSTPIYVSNELRGLHLLHEIQSTEHNNKYHLDNTFWRHILKAKS